MADMGDSRKTSGLGPLLYPSGDISADMRSMKIVYAPFRGKNATPFQAD
jgi:hypothetical protein